MLICKAQGAACGDTCSLPGYYMLLMLGVMHQLCVGQVVLSATSSCSVTPALLRSTILYHADTPEPAVAQPAAGPHGFHTLNVPAVKETPMHLCCNSMVTCVAAAATQIP
jgi:hypothetical protein